MGNKLDCKPFDLRKDKTTKRWILHELIGYEYKMVGDFRVFKSAYEYLVGLIKMREVRIKLDESYRYGKERSNRFH